MANEVALSAGSAMDLFTTVGTAGLVSAVGALVVNLAVIVLMIVSWWNIYDKMGEKGWKCLIPFYGKYTLYSCVWEAKIYFISLALRIGSFIMSVYGVVILLWQMITSSLTMLSSLLGLDMTAIAAYLPTGGGGGVLLFAGFFSVASAVVNLILNWRMVKCFGYGVGFFLGITFFPIIFIPVLAFGNAYFDYY